MNVKKGEHTAGRQAVSLTIIIYVESKKGHPLWVCKARIESEKRDSAMAVK